MPSDPAPFLECLGVVGADVVARITTGADAALWRVRWQRRDYALRVLRPDQRDASHREQAAMDAARAAGIPVPKVAGSAVFDDRPALLIPWCAGETAAERLNRAPEACESVGHLLGGLLAAINAVPAPACLRAEDAPAALLHRDFHPLNVLLDGDRVSGVIDWADARGGDPRDDLARSLCILLTVPALDATFPPPMSPLRRAIAAAFLHGYVEASTLPGGSLTRQALADPCQNAAADILRGFEARVRARTHGLTDASLTALRRWRDGDLAWAEGMPG